MMELLLIVLLMVVFLLLKGFFSGSEPTSLRSC